MKSQIIINGKYLTSRMTAVHRVADELILALDRHHHLWETSIDLQLVVPVGCKRRLNLVKIPTQEIGVRQGQIWEQYELPRHAKGAYILNLCNMAPAFYRNSITLIHDLQVYDKGTEHSLRFSVLYKSLIPRVCYASRRLMAVSKYTQNEILRKFPSVSNKLSVIYNGCDHGLRVVVNTGATQKHSLEKRSYVLALSSTKKHKNIKVLLKAFEDVRLDSVLLVLFGDTTRAEFEALGHSVPPNVRFIGRIPDEDLFQLMQDAIALACPSTTEGFGLPPLEAMLFGCPAIISPCGALPEVCGGAALIAEPHNAGSWVERILQLDIDSEKRDEISEAGKRRALQFSWDSSGTRLAEEMLSAISDS